jgi:hypothetical protein
MVRVGADTISCCTYFFINEGHKYLKKVEKIISYKVFMSKKVKPDCCIFYSAEEDIKHVKEMSFSDHLMTSLSYKLAYDDLEFIHSDEMCPARLMMELSKPEPALNEN